MSTWPTVTGSTIVNDGIWHKVLVTKDNSNVVIYVDSPTADASGAMTSAETLAPSFNFCVGSLRETSSLPVTSGLIADWDPSLIVPASHVVDGRVATLPDALAAHNATQAVAANRPLYIPQSSVDGRPGVLFGGNDSGGLDPVWLDLPSYLGPLIDSDITIFFVIVPNVDITPSTTPNVLTHRQVSPTLPLGVLTFGSDSYVPNAIFTLQGHTATLNIRASDISSTLFQAGSSYMFRSGIATATVDIAVNGVPSTVGSGTGTPFDSSSSQGFPQFNRIGSSNNAGGSTLDAELKRFLIFNRRLTGAEDALVERYMALRYNISLATIPGQTRADMTFGGHRSFSAVPTLAERTALLDPNSYPAVLNNQVNIRSRFDPEPTLTALSLKV